MVTDKIQDLESNLFKVLGTNPKSLQFAEFALRSLPAIIDSNGFDG